MGLFLTNFIVLSHKFTGVEDCYTFRVIGSPSFSGHIARATWGKHCLASSQPEGWKHRVLCTSFWMVACRVTKSPSPGALNTVAARLIILSNKLFSLLMKTNFLSMKDVQQSLEADIPVWSLKALEIWAVMSPSWNISAAGWMSEEEKRQRTGEFFWQTCSDWHISARHFTFSGLLYFWLKLFFWSFSDHHQSHHHKMPGDSKVQLVAL